MGALGLTVLDTSGASDAAAVEGEVERLLAHCGTLQGPLADASRSMVAFLDELRTQQPPS